MYSLGIVTEAFLGIILTLDTWVYSLISSAYKIFMAIASARILQEDAYKAIAEKVYIIVGVGMLFVLAYAILKAIVDPDQTSKGDMAGGKIVKSIAIAVIGLIVTPMIFNLCYMAQGKILEDDILGKLFFRTEESVDTIKDVNQNDTGIEFNYDEALHNTGGAITATSVWQAFFYPAEGEDASEIIADPEIAKLEAAGWTAGCAALGVATVVSAFYSFGLTLVVGGAATLSCFTAHQKGEAADKIAEAAGDDGEVSLQEAYMIASAGEGFAIFQAFVEPIDEGQIKYTWFISTVCGVFVAYAFATYAIDMGLRAAKLAYYQVIAPIPLILQVLPKKGDIFSKYVKAVFTTFLEVFIRISVVYIVIYIIAHLNTMFSTDGALWDSQSLTKVESMIAMALLIIGLVLFAKQAPKLISETFGLQGGADLGLSMMKRLREGEVFTAGHVVGSTIRGGVQGAVAGAKKDGKWYQKIGRGIGSAVAGASSSAVRSGYSRFKNGKPVQGFKEMNDGINSTTRAVADKRRDREDWMSENPTWKDKAINIGKRVKDSAYAWAVGDVDLSREQADIKFAGALNGLTDSTRAEAEKKDPTTKALAKEEERLSEPLSKYREGWSEERRNSEIGERMRADTTYQNKEAAYATAKADVDSKKVALDAAKEAYEDARNRGADAATLAGLESTLRTKQAEHQAALAAFTPISSDFEAYRDGIISRVDAVAKMSDEEFTAASIQRQKDLKAARDKKEAAADAYVAEQLADPNSIIRNQVQTLLSENAEYISKNANREIIVEVKPDGTQVKKTVGRLIEESFGSSALTNAVVNTEAIMTGNTFKVTRADGRDVEYKMEVSRDASGNVVRDAKGNLVFVYKGDGVTLTREQFNELLVQAKTAKADTKVTSAAESGKTAKRTIPLTQEYMDKVTRKRKEEKK